ELQARGRRVVGRAGGGGRRAQRDPSGAGRLCRGHGPARQPITPLPPIKGSPMTVKLGINPIGWTNDCMHWLGDFITLERCLAEVKQAGFSGVELGRKFPRQAAQLGPLLEAHDLQLVSGWYNAELLTREAKAEIAAMRDHLTLLAGLGSSVMVFAETTKEIINHVGAPASARPTIGTAAEWKRLGQRFTAVADHLQAKGVRMAVHHHMG